MLEGEIRRAANAGCSEKFEHPTKPKAKKDAFAALMATAREKKLPAAKKQPPTAQSTHFAYGPNADALIKVARDPQR